MPRESKTSPRRLAAHDRHLRALALRKAGYTFRAIANELGYNDQAAAYHAIMKVLADTAREPADEVRGMELDRLDDMLSRIAKRIQAGDLAAIDTALRIQTRRAKLLGLDAPVKQEHSGRVEGAPVSVNVVYEQPKKAAEATP